MRPFSISAVRLFLLATNVLKKYGILPQGPVNMGRVISLLLAAAQWLATYKLIPKHFIPAFRYTEVDRHQLIRSLERRAYKRYGCGEDIEIRPRRIGMLVYKSATQLFKIYDRFSAWYKTACELAQPTLTSPITPSSVNVSTQLGNVKGGDLDGGDLLNSPEPLASGVGPIDKKLISHAKEGAVKGALSVSFIDSSPPKVFPLPSPPQVSTSKKRPSYLRLVS